MRREAARPIILLADVHARIKGRVDKKSDREAVARDPARRDK